MEWVRRLWRGDAPLSRAFWEYAIGYGTLAHVATTGLAYGTYVAGIPLWLAAVVFFIAAPYTLLVAVGVWRSAGRYQGPAKWALAARVGVLAWAVAATLL